jgi:hypothetical protein
VERADGLCHACAGVLPPGVVMAVRCGFLLSLFQSAMCQFEWSAAVSETSRRAFELLRLTLLAHSRAPGIPD